MENTEGILSLSIAPIFKTSENSLDMSMSLEGISYMRDITTEMMMLYYPFSIKSHAHNDNENFKKPYAFTWFYWQTDYNIFKYKKHFINAGFRTGHEGFLYEKFTGSHYYFFLGIPIRYNYLLNRSWMAMNELVLSLPFYQKNTGNHLQFENTLEIQYDPYHSILNPDPESALYSVGLTVKRISIHDPNISITKFLFDIFIKISVLY